MQCYFHWSAEYETDSKEIAHDNEHIALAITLSVELKAGYRLLSQSKV